MKILLSGGWGYGNLGDDAILYASLKLVNEKFPNSEIIIFSYDPVATFEELNGRYKVVKSVHRVAFGKTAYKQLSVYKKYSDFTMGIKILGAIKRRIKDIYNKLFPLEEPIVDYTLLSDLETLFREADMFIMSGGGYFNNWKESLQSRVAELTLAQKYGLKNYIIGQTLDDYQPQYKEELRSLFQNVSAISVRDEKSKNVLSQLGIESHIAPDLVLSGLDLPVVKNQSCDIVFILAELPIKYREEFIEILSHFVKERSLSLRIGITRLYNADIRHAKWCAHKFRENGIDVQFRIPNSFMDIWNDIAGVKYIISRNLHGLILGYVGGGNVLSINEQWKFEGFLSQIGAEDAIIKFDKLSRAEIYLKLDQFYRSEINNQKRMELAEHVKSSFFSLFGNR